MFRVRKRVLDVAKKIIEENKEGLRRLENA